MLIRVGDRGSPRRIQVEQEEMLIESFAHPERRHALSAAGAAWGPELCCKGLILSRRTG